MKKRIGNAVPPADRAPPGQPRAPNVGPLAGVFEPERLHGIRFGILNDKPVFDQLALRDLLAVGEIDVKQRLVPGDDRLWSGRFVLADHPAAPPPWNSCHISPSARSDWP
jgi:hypothetical protein